MADENQPRQLQPVEILHIDTAGSQAFFDKFEVNASEKCDCQKILFDLFSECCQQHGGYVASNWQGDGGHAFFPATQQIGRAIQAAQDFISKYPILAQQTATLLGGRAKEDTARRRFRIKCHFGMVYVSADSRFDAGQPKDFDAFLKHERDLAPLPDEVFITSQLRAQLGGPQKELFQQHKGEAKYGGLTTTLYRLVAQPNYGGRNLLAGGQRPQDITDSEWRYLRCQLISHKMNVAARNSITTGLINSVSPEGTIDHFDLRNLTLRALYNFLSANYPYYSFRVTLWASPKDGYTEAIAYYPPKDPANQPARRVPLDARFKVVQTVKACSPVVTQCVTEARLNGDWMDFDPSQAEPKRGLQSALQLPVYRTKNPIGAFVEKELLGALSIDTDKPDFFLKEELDLWCDELIGFLANLALSEHMGAVKGVGGTAMRECYDQERR